MGIKNLIEKATKVLTNPKEFIVDQITPKQILLVGPLRAGKTQIRHSYADDTDVIPTNGRKQSEKAELMFLSKKRLLEIGGGSQEMTDYPFSEEAKDKDCVMFVFDGTEFLKQVNNPSEGGEIYARLKNQIWNAYDQPDSCIKKDRLKIVATHKDLCNGDLKQEIINAVDKANVEYKKITGVNRYKRELFEPAYFYCINACDKTEVENMFNRILD